MPRIESNVWSELKSAILRLNFLVNVAVDLSGELVFVKGSSLTTNEESVSPSGIAAQSVLVPFEPIAPLIVRPPLREFLALRSSKLMPFSVPL